LVIGFGAFITYRITENSTKKNASKDKAGSKQPSNVSRMVLLLEVFADNLSLSGSIEANEQIEIRSEVSGVVESINFTEGSSVSQGQVLFKVNDIELRAQLAQVKTAQSLASENERRAKLLLQKEAISQEEYDISSADFQSAKAQTQLIQAQLAKTSVRVPFSGKIGLRYISKGTYVTPTSIVANLVNTSKLKITFSIPEKYAPKMKANSAFTLTTSESKEVHTATVYAIEPGVEISTRTLKMRAIAENPDGKLLHGTFANVSLPLEKITDALLVTSEALIPIQNGKKIFVAKSGKATEVIFETGAHTDKSTLVTSELKAGDTILTTGVMSLKEGSQVKVTIK
jgi:membrane fusion protein (multidrug efflux system)